MCVTCLFWVIGIQSSHLHAQLAGLKTVGIEYPSIAAFVTDLNLQGVQIGGGGVTLQVPSGHVETAPVGGYSITATGYLGDPIIINGGTGPNPVITANAALVAGSLNDAIFKIIGGDYITISNLELTENAANTTTTAGTNNMTEWGIALLYNTTSDGATNCSLENNTITLNRTYQNTFGIYVNATHAAGSPTTSATAIAGGGNNGLKVYGNIISNVNTGILVVGPTGAANQNDGIDIGGTTALTGNTITNFGTTGTFSSYANVSGSVNGIVVSNSKNVNVSRNTVASSVGGTTSGTLRGIYIQGASNTPTGTFTTIIANNNISLRSAAASGAIHPIQTDATTTSATSNTTILNNDVNNTTHTVASSAIVYCIYNLATTGGLTIEGNTFSNLTVNTTGTLALVYNSNSLPTYSVTNNAVVGSVSKTGAGGNFYGFYNFGSPGAGTATITGNNFSNITVTGAVTFYGIRQATANSQTAIVQNNTISNITGGTSTLYAISQGYGTASNVVSGNSIFNITSGSTLYGLQVGDGNGGGGLDCYNNVIYGLSTTGASTVYGLHVANASTFLIRNNKIYSLSANNAAGTVYGINVGAGTNVSVYNNMISDLTAPITSSGDAIRAISVTSTTTSSTVNVLYNTVFFNASSTGTDFGTSGIYHTASATATTANLVLRNNIIVNRSIASGTGLISAYRRSGTSLANYSSTSNNNLFFAGVPSTSTLIFTDGTTPQQTLAGFQGAIGGRELNSITGEGAFTYGTPGSFFVSLTGASVDFLRPVAGITTQVEGGAANITNPLITVDNTDVIRAGNAGYTGTGTAPDMGAYEFEGVSPAPVIVLNSVTPGTTTQCTTTPRDVSATITTTSGSIASASLVYAFNGVPQGSIAMTNSGGDIWTGTLPVATPTNATVSWSIVATNTLAINSALNGTSYADDPTFGITASASANTTTTCSNDPATLTASVMNTSPAATYTAPPAVSFPTTDEDLGNITITQGVTTILNNTTARNSLVGTIGTATGTAGSYSNFTSFGPFNLNIGDVYDFSVSSLQDAFQYNNALAIYIDYNRNGVFTDAGEQVYTSPALVLGAHTRSGSFTVPATAASGLTRMRVINNEASLITSPTQTVGYGEYEEYTINLVPSFTVTWMDGVTAIGTTNPITVNPAATTTYTAMVNTAGCSILPSPTVTINVNPLPSAPTTVSSAQCGTQVPTASITSTSGLPTPTFVWYDMPTGGTIMQSDISSTYTSNVAATTTFYVSELDGVTGCESARTSVTITVATADDISATASASSICIGETFTLTAANTNPSPLQSYTYSWDGVANSGVGSSVPGASISVTPTLPGTYQYDLTGVDGGCSAIALTTVTVNPFVASVTAVDVSCNGYNNGSFTLASSSCGTMPYTYSVDGGVFGGIPSDLAPGSYTVQVQDDNGYLSAVLNITISEPSTVIPAPTTVSATVCLSNPVADISATATIAPIAQTLTLPLDISVQPTEVNVAPGVVVTTVTVPALPAGSVVTGVTINVNGLVPHGGEYQSDVRLGLSGIFTNAAAQGTGAIGFGTVAESPFNYTRAMSGAGFPLTGGALNLLYWDNYNDVLGGDDCSFPIGSSVGSIVINYTIPAPTTISWWDASTMGNLEGTGSPFNAVGTATLPNTNTPGVYTLYAQGEYLGCSSLSRTPVTVTVNPTSASTTTLSNCASYTWTNGTTYTTSGMYTQTLTNSFGCDSIATLDLTILDASASTTTISQCGSYLWTNGSTYSTSGMYTQTLTNSIGCDSIATLDLTILSPSASTTTIAMCDTYTWTDGITYTTSGMYTQMLTNAIGCDSIATLDLTINSATAGTLNMAACDAYLWEGTTYTASGTYTAMLVNSAGCDSLATLNLTINTATSGSATMAACDAYLWEGTTYTASGTYTATLINSAGCDSLATLVLTINASPLAAATDNGDNTLTSSSATGNQWINCGTNQPVAGATSQNFTPTANGSYAVIVTGAGGCADTSSCITISTIGIKEIDQDIVSVYPNPTLGVVKIDFPYNSAVVKIVDAHGKVIDESSIVSGQEVSLENCERGLYYFTVTTAGGSSIHKIVKQ